VRNVYRISNTVVAPQIRGYRKNVHYLVAPWHRYGGARSKAAASSPNYAAPLPQSRRLHPVQRIDLHDFYGGLGNLQVRMAFECLCCRLV